MAQRKKLADSVPRFWRDDRLPFIEARYLADGRSACYDRHAHQTFSIGAITEGASNFVLADVEHRVHAGSVVIINPGQVHACNPVADLPWSYCMLYVEQKWPAQLQRELQCESQQTPEQVCAPAFQPYATAVSSEPVLYEGLLALYETLIDADEDLLGKQGAVIEYFSQLHSVLQPATGKLKMENTRLKAAAEFIDAHCTQELSFDDISQHVGLSSSYLFRAFKKQYGMTPHTYLINRRVQYAQEQLKRGVSIVDAAMDAGFADQAHFQRVFKRLLSATPGQYQINQA